MATLKTQPVIEAMQEMKGNIAAVARKFRKQRHEIYTFMEKHPTVKQAREEARESMLDNAESALYRNVLAGDNTALIFFLKTQGAKRGYTERIDHQDSSGSKAILELAGAIRKSSGHDDP